jgi:serine/threonine protein kinase
MDFPHFVVTVGDDKDRLFPVHPGSGHLLGRSTEASYILRDYHVGKFHSQIDAEDGVVTVRCVGGPGGTLVNGVPVREHVLKHGDAIQVGETVIRYLMKPMSDAELNGGGHHHNVCSAEVEALAELSGTDLSHYRLGEVLGKGSAGMVFKATDTAKGKTYALKVLAPSFGKCPDDRNRFVAAMKATMPLAHPNLVRVYGAGQAGPYLWAALELVEGECLSAVVQRITDDARPGWKFGFRIGLKIARGLAFAHSHGVMHKALCPASVMIREADREVKIEDLMLAKACEVTPGHTTVRPHELTGDVDYMSPERTAGGAVKLDHRSDLFSLGATTYALLTGHPPFHSSTAAETVAHIRTGDPAPLRESQPEIPPAFDAAVMKLLNKHPSDRYQSAAELVAELEQIGKTHGLSV